MKEKIFGELNIGDDIYVFNSNKEDNYIIKEFTICSIIAPLIFLFRTDGFIKKVQITPNIVKRAVEYVIKYRIEKNKVHWTIAYFCPFLDSMGGIVFAICLERFDNIVFIFIAIISFSIMAIAVTCQIMYHIKSN